MRASWLAAVSYALAGCAPPAGAPTRMEMPGVMRQALTAVSSLEATAELVAADGATTDPVPLARAADGVSFSGFIPAEPGDYRLEVVFRGVPQGGTDLLFLGRWTSDGFTVTAGASAAPQFSSRVDTIGRPEDGGDPDGDGFGNLDELLYGTDPTAADSDGDGVDDGEDCDPVDPADAFTIVSGGSVDDCDGDGVRRPDVSVGSGGNDCDDRDPTIHPGATDDCADGIDQDCNPSTCPVNDVTAPQIEAVDPPAGATVGCHTRVSATVRDDGNISSASLYLEEPVPGQPVTILMEKDAGDTYRTAYPFNFASSIDGLTPGQHSIEVRATDNGGNQTTEPVTYDFAFDVPSVTSLAPAVVGAQSAPFTLSVQASAVHGVASVQLMARKRSASGTYQTDLATELGRVEGPTGSVDVDPSTFEEGEHLLFLIVTDTVGNQLRPNSVAFPTGGTDGLTVDADYRCIAGPSAPKIPARVLVVGQDSYAPATMKDLYDRAVAEAAATDPSAVMVSIIGFGVRADGTVALDDAASYAKRWQFAFLNTANQRALTVSWYTPAYATTNPVIDDDAGNVTAEVPFGSPAALVDSDEVVNAYHQQGCPALVGDDDDYVLYHVVDQQPVVSVSSASGAFWRGSATSPVVEIFGCN